VTARGRCDKASIASTLTGGDNCRILTSNIEEPAVPDRKRARPDDYFADWKEREALAEDIIPIVGKLARDRRVKCFCYDKSLVNKSVLDVMKLHRYVRQVEDNELSERETHPVLEVVSQLDLVPQPHRRRSPRRQLLRQAPRRGHDRRRVCPRSAVAPDRQSTTSPWKPRDVVLYGFGRIGRLVARILIDKTSGGDSALRLRAVVVRKGKAPNDLLKRASLLRRDSVHGAFDGTIRVDEERQSFVANGNEVRVIYADSPDSIDYTPTASTTHGRRQYRGVARRGGPLEASRVQGRGQGHPDRAGQGRPEKHRRRHQRQYHRARGPHHLTAASCTTNAIVPPLKAIYDEFGIAHGHVETVHSYTNDQNLIDNYHKCRPRGRARR
jgi:glyceraldehyde 3-phosphate dehydrogenase